LGPWGAPLLLDMVVGVLLFGRCRKTESQEFSATGDLGMEIRSVSLFEGRGRLVVYGSQTSDVPRWFVQVWRDLVRHPSRAETRSGHVICQDLRFTRMHLRPLPCIIREMTGQRKLLPFCHD
jgi:hypothetical protein